MDVVSYGGAIVGPPHTAPQPILPPAKHEGAAKKASKNATTWQDLDLSRYAIYGSLFVFGVESVMYPFEVLRTRMQADNILCQKSIFSMGRRIVQQEGWRTLFRGIVPAVSGSFPAQMTYYGAYEFSHHKYDQAVRSWLRVSDGASLSHVQDFICHAVAGLTAEACAAAFYLPSDIVSQRLQAQPKFSFYHAQHRYGSAMDVARAIYSSHGIGGFYRGIVPHLLAFAPSGAVYWGVYESGKKLTTSYGIIANAVAASVAGGAAVVVSNPFDVLRTRVQTYETGQPTGFKQIRALASKVWREEGISGFYKGLRPRLMIAMPGSMVALLGYELIKSLSRGGQDE